MAIGIPELVVVVMIGVTILLIIAVIHLIKSKCARGEKITWASIFFLLFLFIFVIPVSADNFVKVITVKLIMPGLGLVSYYIWTKRK